jgi:hypothetical protein
MSTGVVKSVGSWLTEGTRSMLYLYGPKELALDHTDEAPQIFLKYGIPMVSANTSSWRACDDDG